MIFLPIPRQLMVWRAYVLPEYWRLLTFYHKRILNRQTEGSGLAQSATCLSVWQSHFKKLTSVHLQTLRRDHRTNSLCKWWNNKFAIRVGHSHPTTWNCIAALQKDEICSRRTIIQFEIVEEEPRQHSAAYSAVGARLQHLCIRYRNSEISQLGFLRSCSYNLQLQRS